VRKAQERAEAAELKAKEKAKAAELKAKERCVGRGGSLADARRTDSRGAQFPGRPPKRSALCARRQR
jgi:hypothetical protein